MKPVVLYFPDAVNLRAFILIEKLKEIRLDTAETVLSASLDKNQILKACSLYGAVLQKPEPE